MANKQMKALVLERTMQIEKEPLKPTALNIPKPKENEVEIVVLSIEAHFLLRFCAMFVRRHDEENKIPC